MDYLRSCYSVNVRFGQGSDTLGRITWYFAPEGAQLFEGFSPFRSLNWTDGHGNPGPIGEVVGAPHSYSSGATPPGYRGDHLCGPRSYYSDGLPSPPPPNPQRDQNGVPACCRVRPGGLFWIGAGRYATIPPVQVYYATGGLTLNSAALTYAVNHVYYATGGILLDSTCQAYSGVRVYFASGGLALDSTSYPPGFGGALLDGAALVAVGIPIHFDFIASGGALLAGLAGVVIGIPVHYSFTAGGGLLLDGSATVASYIPPTPVHYSFTAGGGLLLDGSATVASYRPATPVHYSFTAGGGLLLDGSATVVHSP